MIDGHVHLENGELSVDYVMQFVQTAAARGIDTLQILDHTHRFIEFEPIYNDLKTYEVQKTWLENKDMKFKDHISDFVDLMKKIQKMDLPVKVKYGLEVCYVPQYEEKIREILSMYSFDFIVGAIHSIDGILYDMSFSKELLWNQYDVDHIYQRYYDLVFQLIESDLFTQLAHPDTIKLFRIYPSYDLMPTYQKMAEFLKKHHVLQLVEIVDSCDVPVMVYGLKNDFKNELFEGSYYLLVYADKIEEIKTICWCGKKATMVARIVDGKFVKEGEQIMVGGNDMYVSLCRKHYNDGRFKPDDEY